MSSRLSDLSLRDLKAALRSTERLVGPNSSSAIAIRVAIVQKRKALLRAAADRARQQEALAK
jgi:hypothetical protein